MANWHYITVFVSALVLTIPGLQVNAFVKRDVVQGFKQQRRNILQSMSDVSLLPKAVSEYDGPLHSGSQSQQQVNTGSQSPLKVQLTKINKEKASVFAEHDTEQEHISLQQAQHDSNISHRSLQNSSYASADAPLHVKSLISTGSRHVSLNKDSIDGIAAPGVEYHNNAQHNQVTRNKLQMISESSKSLIDRLCAVNASERRLCYQHGSSKCHCSGGLADCSGKPHIPNLSYVPKLPLNIKCLSFAYNNVRSLYDSYFSNVTTFVAIDFSSNKLQTISAKTFERFISLQYLILNYNVIGYKDLRAVLGYPPNLRLDIIGLDLQEVPPDYFYHYWNISTSTIYMDFNFIRNLDLREFARLDNLEYLSLTNSSIQNVISAPMRNLKLLDLDYNEISIFPLTCNSSIIKSAAQSSTLYFDHQITESEKMLHLSEKVSKQSMKQSEKYHNGSLFPSLTYLYMRYNFLLALPDLFCLSNLHTLSLESNNITEISENAFTSLTSLKVLSLDKMNSGIHKIGRSAFNISALTSLYMSKNRIQFDSKDINSKLFEGCSSLEVLSIDHNQLSGVTEEVFEELLSHTPALKYIYLGSTEMKSIPVKAFSQMRNLEKLYIYVNAIKEIPAGAFSGMSSLRYLYMDENRISTLSENSFPLETRLRLKLINLSRNQYICDCNILWFQSWLRDAGPNQFMEFDNYLCSDIPNMSVQDYSLSKQACLFSREDNILFVACLSILIVFFLVCAILYRYRWNIRLMMYERRVPHRSAINLPDDHFRYDLFVVYCNDDCEWVEELLRPTLETKWRLQTCIHQRDFIAGGSIIDNIVESMNASRRILVVVSSRFALSRWCNFELQLCQSHMITHDLPSLIVIILDEIESRDMSAAMLALYNTTCFLEWPSCSSDSREMNTFWTRLEKSLATVINARSQSTSVKLVE